MFLSREALEQLSWQALERAVTRLLIHDGYQDVRLVGQSSDQGADLIAHKFSKRWVFQVKKLKAKCGVQVLDRTCEAARTYKAQIPVIVCSGGFDEASMEHQAALQSRHAPLQLWDADELLRRVARLDQTVWPSKGLDLRKYQESAIQLIVQTYSEEHSRRALVVMATGLGKTVTAAEALRRIISSSRTPKILVLAHTNLLVYQLERAFWSFLTPVHETVVWNGSEKPSSSALSRAAFTFACIDSVHNELHRESSLPDYSVVVIDECHHAGARMYSEVIEHLRAGSEGGPFLLGLTATPWRPGGNELDTIFGSPLVSVDMLTGLRNGFLAKIDYRMYVDNINWEALSTLQGDRLSPRHINRTLFITEWDEAVVLEFKRVWEEQRKPRALIFCGTIDHAIMIRDRINAYNFCNASAIYSGTKAGRTMQAFERNRILSDFHDGQVNALCVVDIFNEGVDVPDVNIIVFQRMTHSRRIFVQQLGRGLRISSEKDKVIVLDFVSDIRRFAAGLELKDAVEGRDRSGGPRASVRTTLNHKVTFRRAGQEDPQSESFLREWLHDIAAIEGADEDAAVLRFPPALRGGERDI